MAYYSIFPEIDTTLYSHPDRSEMNAGSDEMLGELAGQAAMAKKNDFACWKCGSKEHKKIDCPMWKRNKERELGNPRHLKGGEE